MNPRYPIFIPSKGRWEFGLRLTTRALNAMKVSHTVVVEQEEREQYTQALAGQCYSTILTLPEDFRETYRGEYSESGGSVPARNFIWEHALAHGWRRHWVVDDNVQHFATKMRT